MSQRHRRPAGRERASAKITFELPEDDWHTYKRESLWAEDLGSGKYRMLNIPFAVYGYSYNDIVIANRESGELVVQGLLMRGGHSTFRIFLNEGVTPDSLSFKRLWNPLEKLGCIFERATQRLLAIDVPPQADISRVYALLMEGKNTDLWDCEEGHRDHT